MPLMYFAIVIVFVKVTLKEVTQKNISRKNFFLQKIEIRSF